MNRTWQKILDVWRMTSTTLSYGSPSGNWMPTACITLIPSLTTYSIDLWPKAYITNKRKSRISQQTARSTLQQSSEWVDSGIDQQLWPQDALHLRHDPQTLFHTPDVINRVSIPIELYMSTIHWAFPVNSYSLSPHLRSHTVRIGEIIIYPVPPWITCPGSFRNALCVKLPCITLFSPRML